MAERLRVPNSSSGNQQSFGSSPSRVPLISKTLNHCFVIRLERKAVGPVCYVLHVRLTKREGVCPSVPGLIGSILCHSIVPFEPCTM